MSARYQQEQSALEQEMALAQQLRQCGPQRSSPLGALLGGLSNAVGNVGGAYLQKQGVEGQRALAGRMGLLQELLRQQRGAGANALKSPAVDDATLAALMSEGG